MALCVGAVLKGSPLRTMGDILSLYMWHGFATGDFATKHFTGFPQRAAQPLLSVPATVLRLPLVGTRRAGKALDGPYSDICDVAAACGLATCEPLHM